MRIRFVLVATLALLLTSIPPGGAADAPAQPSGRQGRSDAAAAKNYVPAVARAKKLGRYFVTMKAPSLADALRSAKSDGRIVGPAGQRSAAATALASQASAVADARARGGRIWFRYGKLVNAFSATLSPQAAAALAARTDVASVEPVNIVRRALESSVPFIGAPEVWKTYGVTGQGMRVAVVDTGIDYTHADFGGPGTEEAYDENDQTVIEPGTFPTDKVIGGYDFVGENYDVLDDDPNNDVPVPDPDPLDSDGHGTHTSSTCCGSGVEGKVGKGVAPDALLYAVKVWEVGNSTDDVLVAGYEFAVDPNGDGSTDDAVDVLSFSGGVTYGTRFSVEAQAAQSVVDLGTVFVASAGNDGNQPSGGSAYVTGTPANTPGVIAVAASIDEFVAQTVDVVEPQGVELQDNGLLIHQDWSPQLTEDLTGDVTDAREVDPPADPGGVPVPADRMLCDQTPEGNPFDGTIALVYKGSTGQGDCDGSEKVFRAQEAGAIAVVLWNGFGGFPFGLSPGDFADEVNVPAFMASTADSETLAATASPNPPEYNTQTLTVTLNLEESPIPGFEDSMTDFTSEGPARYNSALKPDVSAPGFNIEAAGVGTGDGTLVLSGTSMAAPHVSGVATLLRQLHPEFAPRQIKALIMNQATQDMKNNDLSSPVSATIMGAGRVQAFESASATSVTTPGSLSFNFRALPDIGSGVRRIHVQNFDSQSHSYSISTTVRYADFDPALTEVQVSLDGSTYGPTATLDVQAGEIKTVWVRLRLHPDVISEGEQELGWYYVHPNMDGNVQIDQLDAKGGVADSLHVPWHVAPLATANDGLSATSLDLTGGSAQMWLTGGPAAGHSYADLYQLGAFGDTTTGGEEDIVAIGARSFTGPSVDGVAEGVPAGTDELVGLTWQEFLTNDNEPTEPIEIGVQTYRRHATTETFEVDALIDAGADGVFADPGLQADYMIVKQAIRAGIVCVYDLSLDDPFSSCSATYFPDYDNYNSNITGLVVDASAIGVTDEAPEFSYKVVACTGRFSGDVPSQICDEAGGFDGTTYTARLNATDPALVIDPLVCQGFWDGGACTEDDPIDVSVGSAQAGDDPSILALFPNNPPTATGPTIIQTTT